MPSICHQCEMNFTPITLEGMSTYEKYLAKQTHRASDLSMGNLWGWAEYYGLEWCFADKVCWIKQTKPEECYWAPVGDWRAVDWTKCDWPAGLHFVRVPDDLLALWKSILGDRLEITETRGHWDYLYLVSELAELKGNRFHRKRNHYNQFLKQYNWSYKNLTAADMPAVLNMQEDWVQWREDANSPSLLAENDAVFRVLQNWERFPTLKGGALFIDDVMAAYTVGEPLSDTLVIHFEKGHDKYRGIYQAINAMFLQHNGEGFTYSNREQDLDDPGLRKAKESYNPVDYVHKQKARVL